MKTIKEKVLFEMGLEPLKNTAIEHAIKLTKKHVLKLIDEGCEQYDSKHPGLTRCCGDILFNNTIWLCPRCEELKAKIEGET